jgi:hypothetical protein
VYNDATDPNFFDVGYWKTIDDMQNALDWRFTTKLTDESAVPVWGRPQGIEDYASRKASPYEITREKIIAALEKDEELRRLAMESSGPVLSDALSKRITDATGIRHPQAMDLVNPIDAWKKNPQLRFPDALFSNPSAGAVVPGLNSRQDDQTLSEILLNRWPYRVSQ